MLTREQFVKLQELFDAVLAAPEAQWSEVSEQLCAECAELREPLAELLNGHRKSSSNATNRLVQGIGEQLQAHIPELVHAGAMIGVYRLHEQIGVGGMGRVYRASRNKDGVTREFALKLLRQELSNSSLLARFQQEKEILLRNSMQEQGPQNKVSF